MNKQMEGKVEFYKLEDVRKKDLKSFQGNPRLVKNNECRRVLKIDGQMWCIILSGCFSYMPTLEVLSVHKKFVKNTKLKDDIELVSYEFYNNSDNSLKDISKNTGLTHARVSNILDKYLLPKSDIVP